MKNFMVSRASDCIKIIQYVAFETADPTPNYRAGKSDIYFRGVLASVFLLLLNTPLVMAQPSLSPSQHANIIYRFTKYINWPESKKKGDFIIGIIGDTPLYDELEGFTEKKTVGKRRIAIKKMSSPLDFNNCNILFISEDKSKSIKRIAEITKGSPVLIVSEAEGLALKGSCINFIVVNEHLKLEFNKNNIEERSLSIASELLSLGTIVK
jgi:hypothetical protein